jgi:hypothetical protein
MTALAPTARAAERAPRRRLAGGVVWIAVTGVLLAGVVALSVAVLRVNMRVDNLGRERAQLRAQNADLASQLSSASASVRIEMLAQQRDGLVPASAADTSYVYLGPTGR